MARAIRNEITITVRFTSYAAVEEDDLEALETVVNEFVRDELNAESISSESEHDDEGVSTVWHIIKHDIINVEPVTDASTK